MFKFFKRRPENNNSAYVPEGSAIKKVRRARFFLFYGIVAIFFVFIAASWLIFRSPFFRISDIKVVGNKSVPDNAVLSLALSGVIRGNHLSALLGTDHYFNWVENMLADRLFFFPELKSAELDKNFRTGGVVITVEERKPRGIWCFRGGCWWFDEDGVVFGSALFAQGSLIDTVSDYSENDVALGRRVLRGDLIPGLFSVFGVLRNSGIAVKEIRLNDLELEEVEVLTFNGPKIYFSLRFLSDGVLAVLKNLMSKSAFKELDYVDFRVENRVYYK